MYQLRSQLHKSNSEAATQFDSFLERISVFTANYLKENGYYNSLSVMYDLFGDPSQGLEAGFSFAKDINLGFHNTYFGTWDVHGGASYNLDRKSLGLYIGTSKRFKF